MRILVESKAGRFTFRSWDAYGEWARSGGHHTVRVVLRSVGGSA